MSRVFDCQISYSTLVVCREDDVDTPLIQPTPEHNAQGFTWRDGTVCFDVPGAHACRLEVLMEDEPASLEGKAERIIKVPFTCNGSEVGFGDIFDQDFISIPKSKYQIEFDLIDGYGDDEHGDPYDYFIRIRFSRNEQPEFVVVKQDEMMKFTGNLVTDAKPA